MGWANEKVTEQSISNEHRLSQLFPDRFVPLVPGNPQQKKILAVTMGNYKRMLEGGGSCYNLCGELQLDLQGTIPI